jgi:hypothetical protein
MVTGTFSGKPITEGRLLGDELTFKAGGEAFTGKVTGKTIQGSRWTATKK